MLRCRTVLGFVAIATLPMACLSSRSSVTWPTSEKFSGGSKNRKGLRHSPGVLMDVMRTPTSVKSTGFWGTGDQTASFSGEHPEHWFPFDSPNRLKYPHHNYIVGRTIANKRRVPLTTFKDHIPPWNVPTTTLNFAPANALPWHTSVRMNLAAQPRPSAVWSLVPYPSEPAAEATPTQTTTPSPPVPQESEVVYRYAPSGTEAPASFTTSGTLRKGRHHVRLFSNAHQYKRGLETSSTTATPSTSTPPLTSQKANIIVDANSIDEEVRRSAWFKQLIGQVIAAAEMTSNH